MADVEKTVLQKYIFESHILSFKVIPLTQKELSRHTLRPNHCLHSVYCSINTPQKHHPLFLAMSPLNLQIVQAHLFR